MTRTSQTVQIAEDAAASLAIAFDGIPSESVAITWLRGYWGMNLERSGAADLFDNFDDFIGSVAVACGSIAPHERNPDTWHVCEHA